MVPWPHPTGGFFAWSRGNQSIWKEINPEYSLEGLMLKLKLQYFGHLMRRTDSLEKTLMLGKIEGKRRREWPEVEKVGWHHWCNGHELGQTPGDGEGQGGLACCSHGVHSRMYPMGSWRVRHNLATEQQQGIWHSLGSIVFFIKDVPNHLMG